MEFLTLQKFVEEVQKSKQNPEKLADIDLDIASKFGMLAEILKDIKLKKAEFWQIKYADDKPLSDTKIEAKWLTSEGGRKEIRLKLEMKSLEHLMAAIKTSSVVNAVMNRQF